jgi:hypothetical protein
MPHTLTVSPTQPGAYPTISDALELAGTGDVVSVAPGEYREALYAQHAQVSLRGIVWLSGSAPAVAADGGMLRIDGCQASARYAAAVTVRDGATLEAHRLKVVGGQSGLVIEDSGGTVQACEILDVDNDAMIIRLGADPAILQCTIARCGSRGIYIYQGARPTIVRCDISRTVDAGISVALGCAPTISQSWVHDVQGVGIAFGCGCHGTVEECTVERTARPGIEVEKGATPTISMATAAAPRAGVGVHAPERPSVKDAAQVDKLLGQLDSMVGLAAVKAEVRALIDELQVNEWRRGAGLAVGAVSHHLIFTGAPGTGKTSVARIYGQLLKALTPRAACCSSTRRTPCPGRVARARTSARRPSTPSSS